MTRFDMAQVECDISQGDPLVQRQHGELLRICMAGQVSTAEWLWIPGPGVGAALKSANEKGNGRNLVQEVLGELLRWVRIVVAIKSV